MFCSCQCPCRLLVLALLHLLTHPHRPGRIQSLLLHRPSSSLPHQNPSGPFTPPPTAQTPTTTSSPLQHQQHSRAIGSPTRCRRPRRPLQRPPMQRLPNLPRRDEANGQPRLRPRVLLYVYSEYAARPKQTLDLAPIFARESALHLLRSPITLPPSPGCLKEQGKQGNCPICRYVPNQNHITQPQTPISPSCAERKPRCEKFDACSCLKDHPSGLFPAETTHSSLVHI